MKNILLTQECINNKKFIILLVLLNIYALLKRKKEVTPKISIFLPIYNMQNYIRKTLILLQKQTLKDIEIISVNDYSVDNTYEILKEFAKKDKRIKVFNNTENKGLLFSRAMGILHSSGKYLINLDPDDEFNDSDSLEYLYNKAIESNADIISFSYLLGGRKKIKNLCDKYDTIINQPDLFDSMYKFNNCTKDTLIWNKLIKKEIFLRAYKLFEKYIYYRKWNFYEDNIWSLLVNKIAKTKLCIKKLIYIYNNINNNSLMKKRKSIIEFSNVIYKFEMTKRILKEGKYFQYMNTECNNLIKSINNRFPMYNHTNEILKNKIIDNLNNCIKFNNISLENKKNAQNIINMINK